MAEDKRIKGTLSLPVKQGDLPPAKEHPIRREEVWELSKGYVSFEIPQKAQRIDSAHVGKSYLAIMRGVKEGSINVFVYAGKGLDRYRGETVIARIVVKKAVYESGREKLYIDLKIAPDAQEATHSLVFVRDLAAAAATLPKKPTFRADVAGGAFVVSKIPKSK